MASTFTLKDQGPDAWKLQFDCTWPTKFADLWLVEKGNKRGIYRSGTNILNSLVVPLKFCYVRETDSPDIWVVKNDYYGIYNSSTNTWAAPAVYNDIYSTNSINLWMIAGLYEEGVYDITTQHWIVPQKYFSVHATNSASLWIVQKNNRLYGIFNSDGGVKETKAEYDKIDLTDDPYKFIAWKGKAEGTLLIEH